MLNEQLQVPLLSNILLRPTVVPQFSEKYSKKYSEYENGASPPEHRDRKVSRAKHRANLTPCIFHVQPETWPHTIPSRLDRELCPDKSSSFIVDLL